jgi:hypothetical protein
MSKTRKRAIIPMIEKKIENLGSMVLQSKNNIRKFIGMTGSQKPKNIKKRVNFSLNKKTTTSHKKYRYTPKAR